MNSLFNNKDFFIWDFDGVIKESLEVKTTAFKKLFIPFGKNIVSKVTNHHKANGGVSRYTKIPIYLNWANIECNVDTIEDYCKSFSELVTQAVIESPWVPGVFDLLKSNYKTKTFFLFTATPQKEIEFILENLGIKEFLKK